MAKASIHIQIDAKEERIALDTLAVYAVNDVR